MATRPRTISDRMRDLGTLSRWLEREGLAVEQLTPGRAEEFSASAEGRMREGVGGRREAGASVSGRLFLGDHERGEELALQRLSAADVSGFLARECPKRTVSGARDVVVELRSLLRYLHVAGVISPPLRWAVPGVADLRDRSLPRGLEPATVAKLLRSCDRRRTVGRRDYALLLLMVRLGLRVGEVAAVRLDDIDWRAGESARRWASEQPTVLRKQTGPPIGS